MTIRRSDIRANQAYLKKWDDYQLEWLNDDNFTKDKALFLPIAVNIGGGIVQRRRVKVPQLKTIMANAGALGSDAYVADALQSYYDYFEPIDGSQSGTPPETPLDFYVNCPVVHLFHLPRDNWEFTDHKQFTVYNVPNGLAFNKMFEVMGVFDDGHALLVRNHNWTPAPNKPFRAKYNLHVSIFQDVGDDEMRTDIIIDPGGNANDGSTGN